MKNSQTFFVLFLILAFCFSVSAQKKPSKKMPGMYERILFSTPSQVDAVNLNCVSKDSGEKLTTYECDVSQILIVKKEPEVISTEAMEQQLKKIKLKEWQERCADKDYLLKKLDLLRSSKHKAKAIETEIDDLDKLCTCKDTECFIDFAIKIAINGNSKGRCELVGNHFNMELERVDTFRWVGITKPDGLCEVSHTNILEYDPKEESWTLTLRKVTSRTDEQCSFITSSMTYYSDYHYIQEALMNCDYISSILP